MLPRRVAARALPAALTFGSAVLVHAAIEAAGARRLVWETPAHAAMLIASLGLLVWAALALGARAPAAERRRRIALARAEVACRSAAGGLLRGALTQGAIACALLGAEGAALQPQRLALALGCGLLALLLTTAAFRATAHAVVDVLAAAFARRERPAAALARIARAVPLVAAGADFRLFVPNRPPPLAA